MTVRPALRICAALAGALLVQPFADPTVIAGLPDLQGERPTEYLESSFDHPESQGPSTGTRDNTNVGIDPAAAAPEAEETISFGYLSTDPATVIRSSIDTTNLPGIVDLFVSSASIVEETGDGAISIAEILGEVSAASVVPGPPPADTGIRGYPTNGGWNWRHADRYTWTTCGVFTGCENEWWVEFDFITEPGEFGSRTQMVFRTYGTEAPSSIDLTSQVYLRGALASTQDHPWSIPGSGIQYSSPHRWAGNRTFQAAYAMTITHPGETRDLFYRTAPSSVCKPGTDSTAFRCVFPGAFS